MLTSHSPGELAFAQFLEREMSGSVTPKWGLSSLFTLAISCWWHFFKSARCPVVRGSGRGRSSGAAPRSLWLRHLLPPVPGCRCFTSHEGGFPGGLWCSVLLCLFNEHRNPSVNILTYNSMQIKLQPVCFNNGLKIQRRWWTLILTLILIYYLTKRLLWILFLFDALKNFGVIKHMIHTHTYIHRHIKQFPNVYPIKSSSNFNVMKWKQYGAKWFWRNQSFSINESTW